LTRLLRRAPRHHRPAGPGHGSPHDFPPGEWEVPNQGVGSRPAPAVVRNRGWEVGRGLTTRGLWPGRGSHGAGERRLRAKYGRVKHHTGEAQTGEAQTGEAQTGEAQTGEAQTGRAHQGKPTI
jgi:hypothetical protein